MTMFNVKTGAASKFRKTILAIAATSVIGVTALSPTHASAAAFFGGHHGGFGHFGGFGGGHRGGFGGFGGGLGLGLGIGLGAELLGSAIANSAQPQSCTQSQFVQLRNGLYRQVVTNVC
ncbi:MAG TPA: hypothetical protein VIY51_06065 [Xanthobacteraceae bacterium]